MKTTFDTDGYLYQILNGSVALSSTVTGGVYNGDRPDGSDKEDITVNTITVSQDYAPRPGTSNVNIHVPDLSVKANGKTQRKADKSRLKELADVVLSVLRSAKIEGVGFKIESQTTLEEAEISQHYVNIRINFFIH